MKTWTSRCFVDLYLLFFIHPGTRRVIVSGITANPDSAGPIRCQTRLGGLLKHYTRLAA